MVLLFTTKNHFLEVVLIGSNLTLMNKQYHIDNNKMLHCYEPSQIKLE